MKTVKRKNNFLSEVGASMVEYALVIALLAVIGIPSLKALGFKVHNSYLSSSDAMGGSQGNQD